MIQENMCAGSRTHSHPLTRKKRGSTSRSTQTPSLPTPTQAGDITARPTRTTIFGHGPHYHGCKPLIRNDIDDIFGLSPAHSASPEQRLWQAVLVEALRCILNGAYVKEVYQPHRAKARQQLRDEAMGWVDSDEDGFLAVCEYAEVNPSYIRKTFHRLLASNKDFSGKRRSLRPRY